jgi:hypothetical protein
MTHHLNQYCELDIKQASVVLAQVTVVNRRLHEKTAGGVQDWLNAAGTSAQTMLGDAGTKAQDIIKNLSNSADPNWGAARHGLIGAGVGAGIGGLASLRQPKGKRRTLANLVQGALLGGTVGGLGSLALNYGNEYLSKVPPSQLQKAITDAELKAKTLQVQGADPATIDAAKQHAEALKAQVTTEPAADGTPVRPPAPSSPPVSTLERVENAYQNAAAGNYGDAGNSLIQNPGGALLGGGVGAAGGYGLGYLGGATADHGINSISNKMMATQRLKGTSGEALEKLVPKGTNPKVVARMARDFNKIQPLPVYQPLPLSARPFTNILEKSVAEPVGQGFRRLGARVGAVTGGIGGAVLGGAASPAQPRPYSPPNLPNPR